MFYKQTKEDAEFLLTGIYQDGHIKVLKDLIKEKEDRLRISLQTPGNKIKSLLNFKKASLKRYIDMLFKYAVSARLQLEGQEILEAARTNQGANCLLFPGGAAKKLLKEMIREHDRVLTFVFISGVAAQLRLNMNAL